jgi:HTH-type transcriptional regulator/antitoxin HipB
MENPLSTPALLGSELRTWRKRRGLTQAIIATQLGLMQKSISAIETHTAQTSVDRLFQLLAALDLEVVVRARSGPAAPGAEW